MVDRIECTGKVGSKKLCYGGSVCFYQAVFEYDYGYGVRCSYRTVSTTKVI